jgi:hypothetical protein
MCHGQSLIGVFFYQYDAINHEDQCIVNVIHKNLSFATSVHEK